MFRTFLMTTATAALMAGGALGQDAQANQETQQQNGQLDIETVEATPAQPGVAGGTGQEVVVNNGDTIVIQPGAQGMFTLNFRLGDAATAGQVGTPTPATEGTTMQRDQLQQADPSQISVDALMGSQVYGANDDNIGEVGDVLLTEEGEVEALVVDVGGFLGIGTHPVAIGLDNLQFMVDEGDNWYVFTPFTQEQLESQPAYDAETYAQDQRLTAQ